MSREEQQSLALWSVFMAAGAGLFVPDHWHPFVFAVIAVAAVAGLYVWTPEDDSDSVRRSELERAHGPDPSEWPPWYCDLCGARNEGWATDCRRCSTVRRMPMP